MKCPVCGSDTFDDNDYLYEICPQCFWEYDIIQMKNPDMRGGANHHSLNEYRKIYMKLKENDPNFSCRNKKNRELILKKDREADI